LSHPEQEVISTRRWSVAHQQHEEEEEEALVVLLVDIWKQHKLLHWSLTIIIRKYLYIYIYI